MLEFLKSDPWLAASLAALLAVITAFVGQRVARSLLYRVFRHRTLPRAV